MKLNIGIMKQIFSLSTNGIKLYEKAGILNPFRQSDNGYREYDVSELQLMGFATQMRSFGYAMQELEQFAHSYTLEQQLESYCLHEKQLDEEINRLTAARKSLLAEIEHVKSTAGLMDRCILGNSEATYFLGMRRGEEFLNGDSPAISGKWIRNYAPHVSSAVLLDGPYCIDASYSRAPLYGVAVDARIALDYGPMFSKDVVFMPPKMSVITGVSFDYRAPDFTHALEMVRSFAEEKKMQLCGGCFIRLNQTIHDADSLSVSGVLYAPVAVDDSDFGIMV